MTSIEATRDEGELPVGQTFAGRYLVRAHIGTGGMGHVYRVLDQALDEEVALKTILASLVTEESLARFKDEVRLARRVTHKNVGRVFDIGVDTSGPIETHYLTMELIVGESLRRRMSRPRPVRLLEALRIGEEIAAGIAAAHEAGVVHRDLKPGNVMLDAKSGEVRLIDFGIAGRLGRAAQSVDDEHRIGTLPYMAPEQLADEAWGPPVDVYALGLVLFEMIAGVRPFTGPDPVAAARARISTRAPDLREALHVDDGVAELVARLLARDPRARPTAADAARTVGAILERMAPGHDAQTMPEEHSRDSVEVIRWVPRRLAPTVGQSVVVLPFGGDPSSSPGLTAALREILSLTSGLRVMSAGPAEAALHGRDAGVALDADAVVEGAVTVRGTSACIAVRLTDVESGRTSWAAEYEGRVGALLELQQRAAQKIAEQLRVVLSTKAFGEHIPDDAMAMYLRSRAHLAQGDLTDRVAAYDDMEECLRQAPGFMPARAARALATARLVVIPTDLHRDWPAIARTAIVDALAHAPDLPDTHLAAALVAEHEGRFTEAVARAEEAIRLAPGFADGHELLGRLFMEAGRIGEGVRRLSLAADLDRRCTTSLALVERAALYRGHEDVAANIGRRIERDVPFPLEHDGVLIRTAIWRKQPPTDPRLQREIERVPFEPGRTLFPMLLDIARGGALAPLLSLVERQEKRLGGTRYLLMMRQITVEVCAVRGDLANALRHLDLASQGSLLDLDWLETCPPVRALADTPGAADAWKTARARVLARLT